jgi:Trk K+ transport system NAD-binding subunit
VENNIPKKYTDVPRAEHIIVCGLGHVGYRIVRLMMRLGQRGVVITRQLNEDWRRLIEQDFHVIVGDAQDDRLLQQAGIADAKAVIIVTDDDLANMSIALDARRMNPRASIVVRQFDQDLAIHLERSADINRALSASALAAPPFVAAALGTTVRCSFAAGDAICNVGEVGIDVGSTWEGRPLGDWSAATRQAPLAICRGPDVMIPDSLDLPLRGNDRIIALAVTNASPKRQSRRRRCARHGPALSLFQRLRVSARLWWNEVPRALRVAMIGLSLVVVISVGVFRAALGLPLVDALYFVVTTITTVGYGDIHLMNAPAALKLYGVFVMLSGGAILAVTVGITTDFILRTRLRDVMAHGAAHYRGHVIVAGLGNIGFRLVRDLVQAGESVVAIEHRTDAPQLQAARELASVVLGDAKNEETLRKAGVLGAKAIIAATDNDLSNLSTALAATRLQPACRTVVRLFNSELADKMQHGLALDAVLSVSGAAAPTFVGAALGPDAIHGFLLDKWLIVVFRQIVGDGSSAVEHTAGMTAEHRAGLFVKRAGADIYESAEASDAHRPGDAILGVRWYSLTEKR